MKRIVIMLTIICGIPGVISFAQSLDDVLGVGQSEYQDSSPETKQAWDKVLSTLEKNDVDASLGVLKDFDGIKDVVEPYQKTFTSLAIQILTVASKPKDIAKPDSMPQQQDIASAKSKIEILQQQILTEENKKPAIQKKIKDASTGGAIGNILGGLAGVKNGGDVSGAGKDAANKEMQDVEKKITEYKTEISNQEKKIVDLQKAGIDEAAKRNTQADSSAGQFRQKVVSFLLEMKDGKKLRPTIALASLWINKKGEDAEVTKISQAALDLQKIEFQAIKIAKAALQPANELIAAGKYWNAKDEIVKAVEQITNRIKDKQQLEFIQREMQKLANDVGNQIKKFEKKRKNILDIAERDANDASKQFEDFYKEHPDYPDYDQDKLKISDLKEKQVEKKFAKKIAAIEEVIPNDPAEAKSMIKKLFETNMDEDEISILKSKVVKLKRNILEKEIELIRKDLDEAQSFLTKFNATYAEELKQGGKPSISLTQTFTIGVENIVRARSMQAGGVKRLELLLTEEMDTVTKSKMVGLLETQKAALAQMDGTLEQNATNKIIAGVLAGVLVLIVVVILVILILKKKKG